MRRRPIAARDERPPLSRKPHGILPGMTGADLPRRVERTEEDLTAVSDTVLDTKGVVDQHTETLAEIHAGVAAVNTRLDALETRVNDGLAEILRRLDAR